MSEIQKQELPSLDIKQQQLENLKQIFPEVFTEGLSVDWEKLKLTLGENVDVGKERYGMNWPGKADCFKTIQQPSIATLVPDREESLDFDNTENLFIEGDNLEVLKLLQKSYLGKIKMIYIDPPYNTGKEFIYPDNYTESLDTYLEYTGQKGEDGKKFQANTDTDGRYHSKWLNMMYPRLFLAKNLLREDGVIFISIDDNEVTNLKSLCNEIFGEENFLAQLIWSNKEGGGSSDTKYFRVKHEYILCYARNIESSTIEGVSITNEDRYREKDSHYDTRGPFYLQKLGMGSIQYSTSLDYAIKCPDGTEVYPKDNNGGKKACWRWSESKLNWGIANDFVIIKKDSKDIWTVYTKQYLKCDNDGKIIQRTQRPFGIIDSFSSTQASKHIDSLGLGNYFNYSKPFELISYLIERVVSKDDIVLDFFAGSGTTANSIFKLNENDSKNRKFICIQLPEPINVEEKAFKTIADISKERIRRVSEKIKKELQLEKSKKENNPTIFDTLEPSTGGHSEPVEEQDLGFKVFKLQPSNFKIWDSTFEKKPEVVQARLFDHIDHIPHEEQQEAILYELLLKSGFPLTTKINTIEVAGKKVFSIEDGLLLICLEKEMTLECLKAMAEMQPTRVICLDEAFEGENADALKTNAVQIMKSKGVLNFRTV